MDGEPSPSQTVRALLGLRELILKGELQPGERLSELALVARLGVSRTPVRSALLRLEEESLVEPGPSGGYTVRTFSEAEIADAIEIRGTLEGTAARLAAERGVQRAELAPIRDCVGSLDAVVRRRELSAEDFSDYVRLNERFHGLLVGLANSPALKRLVERIVALPFASPSAFVQIQAELPESREILLIAQEQHRAIVEAIERREGARAEALAREHSRVARRNLQIVLNNQQSFARMPGGALIRLRDSA